MKRIMEENKLTPFDNEGVKMIETITERDAEIELANDSIIVFAFCVCLSISKREEMVGTVREYFGKRIRDVQYVRTINAVVFVIRYTDEYKKMPWFAEWKDGTPKYSEVGQKYCLKLREVWAVRFTRENAKKVHDFIGNGMMVTPRKPGMIATYEFANLVGLNLYAKEGDWIVYDKDFRVVGNMDFEQIYEPKFGNILPVEEMNERFGKDLYPRCLKLSEEYNELMEVINQSGTMSDEEFVNRFLDELSDINAVVFHIASILGKSQTELLKMAGDKIRGRFENPNYKRIHPHKE